MSKFPVFGKILLRDVNNTNSLNTDYKTKSAITNERGRRHKTCKEHKCLESMCHNCNNQICAALWTPWKDNIHHQKRIRITLVNSDGSEGNPYTSEICQCCKEDPHSSKQLHWKNILNGAQQNAECDVNNGKTMVWLLKPPGMRKLVQTSKCTSETTNKTSEYYTQPTSKGSEGLPAHYTTHETYTIKSDGRAEHVFEAEVKTKSQHIYQPAALYRSYDTDSLNSILNEQNNVNDKTTRNTSTNKNSTTATLTLDNYYILRNQRNFSNKFSYPSVFNQKNIVQFDETTVKISLGTKPAEFTEPVKIPMEHTTSNQEVQTVDINTIAYANVETQTSQTLIFNQKKIGNRCGQCSSSKFFSENSINSEPLQLWTEPLSTISSSVQTEDGKEPLLRANLWTQIAEQLKPIFKNPNKCIIQSAKVDDSIKKDDFEFIDTTPIHHKNWRDDNVMDLSRDNILDINNWRKRQDDEGKSNYQKSSSIELNDTGNTAEYEQCILRNKMPKMFVQEIKHEKRQSHKSFPEYIEPTINNWSPMQADKVINVGIELPIHRSIGFETESYKKVCKPKTKTLHVKQNVQPRLHNYSHGSLITSQNDDKMVLNEQLPKCSIQQSKEERDLARCEKILQQVSKEINRVENLYELYDQMSTQQVLLYEHIKTKAANTHVIPKKHEKGFPVVQTCPYANGEDRSIFRSNCAAEKKTTEIEAEMKIGNAYKAEDKEMSFYDEMPTLATPSILTLKTLEAVKYTTNPTSSKQKLLVVQSQKDTPHENYQNTKKRKIKKKKTSIQKHLDEFGTETNQQNLCESDTFGNDTLKLKHTASFTASYLSLSQKLIKTLTNEEANNFQEQLQEALETARLTKIPNSCAHAQNSQNTKAVSSKRSGLHYFEVCSNSIQTSPHAHEAGLKFYKPITTISRKDNIATNCSPESRELHITESVEKQSSKQSAWKIFVSELLKAADTIKISEEKTRDMNPKKRCIPNGDISLQ